MINYHQCDSFCQFSPYRPSRGSHTHSLRDSLTGRPDVSVEDASDATLLRNADGAEATHEINAKLPDTKVLILTTFGTSDGIAHALEAGARGALMKTTDDATIVTAIREVGRDSRQTRHGLSSGQAPYMSFIEKHR